MYCSYANNASLSSCSTPDKQFLPKSQNYSKAFNNWERRSRYLLKEMVKYQIYVECLEQSIRFQTEAREAQEAEAVAAAEAELVVEAEEATIVAEADVPSGRSSAELERLEVPTDDESCPTEVAVSV